MPHETYVATAEHEGLRADAFLALVSPHTRSSIALRMQQGRVTSGESPVKARDKVRAGQCFVIALDDAVPVDLIAQDLPIGIVYQDEWLAVINKPKGMSVHPGAGVAEGTLVNALLHHLDHLSGINGEIRPGIVHRLDKDTTGLLLIAKNDEAHRSLSAQIAAREVKREYLALVHAVVREEEGTIDAPIGRHPKQRKRMAVVQGGREARTHYQVLHRYLDSTLLQLMLETGRTHQIRVHLAHLQHPVVNDPVYGIAREHKGDKTQLLHAFRLSFTHPHSGQRLTFCAPLPADFERELHKRGDFLPQF